MAEDSVGETAGAAGQAGGGQSGSGMAGGAGTGGASGTAGAGNGPIGNEDLPPCSDEIISDKAEYCSEQVYCLAFGYPCPSAGDVCCHRYCTRECAGKSLGEPCSATKNCVAASDCAPLGTKTKAPLYCE